MSGGDCCCSSHINSHNQVRGHRTGSSHSGVEEYPREKTQTNQRWYTHISELTQFMPPPETYKSEIGSQPTMCQIHTGAYVSLLVPGKNRLYRLPPKKDYHVYIARSTYHYAYARQTQVSWRKETKKSKEKKIKERKKDTRKRKNEKGKERQDKTRTARKNETRGSE